MHIHTTESYSAKMEQTADTNENMNEPQKPSEGSLMQKTS